MGFRDVFERHGSVDGRSQQPLRGKPGDIGETFLSALAVRVEMKSRVTRRGSQSARASAPRLWALRGSERADRLAGDLRGEPERPRADIPTLRERYQYGDSRDNLCRQKRVGEWAVSSEQ